MTRLTVPMTTATGFGPLPELIVEQAGRGARRRAFGRAGLPEAIADTPSQRLPMAAMMQLFHEAARATGNPLFGIHVGLRMEPGAYGPWIGYAHAAETLRGAIDRLDWGLPLHQTGSRVGCVATCDGMAFAYVPPRFPDTPGQQHAEHVLPSLVAIARSYLGADWQPRWVGLPHAARSETSAIEDALGVSVHGDCPGVLVAVADEDLDRRRPVTDPTGHPTRSDILAGLRARTRSLPAAVEDCIRLELMSGAVGIERVAARMAVSTRSLQRGLSRDGTSFCGILETVRKQKAAELLAMPGAHVASVAAALGYADPSNFARAYRRWTGQTPTEAHGG